tara:strand:+ start:1054 stop:1404 length:351 start_codon:yes stop_codon:yes gene_type:complete
MSHTGGDREISFSKRDDLKTFIQHNKHVIVRVSAVWCGPCKKIAPLIKERVNNLPNNVQVVYVDLDKHRDVASALKIKNVPTFLSFLDGAPDVCLVGADSTNVKSFFNKVVAKVSI